MVHLELGERRKGVTRGHTIERADHRVEWILALVITLSIGLDPSITLWRAAANNVPAEFRTVSISASDAALLILALYGWWPDHHESTETRHDAARAIGWAGALLIGCLGLSAAVAGLPWLSLMRFGQVVLGLLACLTLTRRQSLAVRVLVCGAGLILLQLPQVIVQELTQSSRSLGSLFPGASPVTQAHVSGALVVFGPGNQRWQRGMGSFLHPNLLGGFLALALVFSLPWLADGGRRGALLWPVWMIAWVELFLTFSRAALIASVAGCLLWGLARYRHAVSSRQMAAFAGLPVVAVVGLATVIGNVLIPRLDPSSILHSVSLTDRWYLVQIGARIVAAHPLLGVGPGTYSLVEAHSALGPVNAQPVHVVPLLVGAEAGIVAGLAWLALVLGGPLVELIGERFDGRAWCERLAVPLVIVILASLDHYFWTFASGQALFWVALGVWASWSEPSPHLDGVGIRNPGAAFDVERERIAA